jgi:hypothetical protein
MGTFMTYLEFAGMSVVSSRADSHIANGAASLDRDAIQSIGFSHAIAPLMA